MAPPVYIPDAFVMKHNGTTSEMYQLYFSKIPGEYFAQEIRLTAWVKGTTSSLFANTIVYTDGTITTTTPEYEVLDTVDGWEKRRVRIPLT